MRIGLNLFKLNNTTIFNAKNNNVALNPFAYPNLAPLDRDTVSFTGGGAILINSQMKDAPRDEECRSVAKNALPARAYLDTVLDKYIAPFMVDSSNSKRSKEPVERIQIRVKKPSSIKEKVVSKYQKLFADELDDFSEKTYTVLSQFFPMVDGSTKNDAIEQINSIGYNLSQDLRLAPYDNYRDILENVFLSLVGTHPQSIFDTTGMDENQIQKIKSDIYSYMQYSSEEYDSKFLDAIGPQTVEGIKYYAQDVVGARILLKESTVDSAKTIIEQLADAVKAGDLKITSIENNIPDPNRLKAGKKVSDYIYAPTNYLERLANIAGAEYKTNYTKSGYLAIHINVEFSDERVFKKRSQFNGYCGEIQIIGTDVEKLKDVEDLCYKCKDNKLALHKAYKPFVKHFQEYYVGDDVKKAFEDYTYDLYLHQKSLTPGEYRKATFPSIKEMGYEGKVPPELDFNKLAVIKAECDAVKKKLDDAAEIRANSHNKSSSQKAFDQKIKQMNYNINDAII